MSAHDRYLQRALTLANHNISHGGRPFGAVQSAPPFLKIA